MRLCFISLYSNFIKKKSYAAFRKHGVGLLELIFRDWRDNMISVFWFLSPITAVTLNVKYLKIVTKLVIKSVKKM